MMKLKHVRLIYISVELLTLALAIFAFVGPLAAYKPFLLIGAVAGLSGCAYLDYVFWRCPNCGAHLGRRMVPAPHGCRNCGHRLSLEEVVLKENFPKADDDCGCGHHH